MRTEERSCEEARRQPAADQGETSGETTPASTIILDFFITVRKQTSVVLQATQSAVFCYGGPSKLIHTQHPNSVKL